VEDLLELIIIANDVIEPLLSASRLRRIDEAMARIAACLVNSGRPAGSFMAFLVPPEEALTDFDPKTGMAITVAEAFVTVLQTFTLMLHDLLLQPQAVWLQLAEPDLPEEFIEHILSVSNPTLLIGRAVKADAQIGGCPFAAGETRSAGDT
jgi:cytochrome P450